MLRDAVFERVLKPYNDVSETRYESLEELIEEMCPLGLPVWTEKSKKKTQKTRSVSELNEMIEEK